MSEPDKHVVIVDPDSDAVEKTANIVTLLDRKVHCVADPDTLLEDPSGLADAAVVLVRHVPALELIERTATILQTLGLSLPCFLHETCGASATIPPDLEDFVLGILPEQLGYQDVLGALHKADLFQSYRTPLRKEYSSHLFRTLVGSSRGLDHVRNLIRQVGPSEASVLILGESGTGKEVVARNVHYYSKRREQPFVPVNCGAIPPDLLESELFGHEKGAFTGAYSARQGRFELAEGGTLFLDEIGDMPLAMQVKLLRVLQEHTFERVGSNTSMQADVRIVAATHQNLEHLVSEGKFRMDLYYRLNVFPIEMPPLRDRVEDIPMLIKGFVHRIAQEKRGSPRLDASAQAALAKYFWPGNVRELANLVERLAILYPNRLVKWSDLPEKFRLNRDWVAEQLECPPAVGGEIPPGPTGAAGVCLPADGIDLKNYLADIESGLMTQALESCEWVVARAAKMLNIQRTTLVEKMRKYAIERPEELTNF
tara:strand:- start:51769 stop:53217 length:1449 start_codon:yes stop_codon:yes gene_type:complete